MAWSPWSPTRQEQMTAFAGILQVDGDAAYKALVRRRRSGAKVRLVFCLRACLSEIIIGLLVTAGGPDDVDRRTPRDLQG